MAPQPSVEYVDNSKNVLTAVNAKTAKDMVAFLEEAADVAKTNAPIDTGALRESIDFEPKSPSQLPPNGFKFFTRTGYGAWLELGTSKIAPRHFMQEGIMRGAKVMEQENRG
jgi:hypothetical protein